MTHGAHAVQLAVAHVEHVDLLGTGGRAIMLDLDHRGIETDAHWRGGTS
jgi:hypothetical protein